MDWVKQRKLPAVEAIRYQGKLCHDLPDLWNALHGTYNAAAGRPVNADILQEAPSFPARDWRLFSFLELKESLSACAGNLAPGPNHITWSHLKDIVSNEECANLLLRLANACITYAHWPTHFKESVLVIIPKPGKPAYDTPKAFRPIVLLNTIGKLIEKMLSRCMQFDAVKHNVLHPNQLGGVIQRSTEDAGVFLTHLVRAGWAKNLKTSVIAFDIAQFFPSLNHELLVTILRCQGFPALIADFFSDYLVGRSTQFLWNSFLSYACDANVGMGQGSTLSPILSALYIVPLMFIFDHQALAAKLDTSLLSFVDDRLIISQGSYDVTLPRLKAAYRIMSMLMPAFGLVMEHDKSKIFHFSCVHLDSNPDLDLTNLGANYLIPKNVWRYLGFYFDRWLSFKEHVRSYATKALTMVKAMSMLGNSIRGLSPIQKRLLYGSCIVPVAIYGY
ncbi:hypothetical protein NP233_g10643 [Leucocoprinus birnbaumii]|uniref:Reverse transcriptase domain-containing protein n=1 Tax=Leucocoprinus birnbaumii TaxID=56174 RepID=A0AAD5VI04_9AGAR|nr:hypothetical protein NP233_g10643 [Leucocoprinus birnbaumii]